jgi:hypothetical protein
MVFAAGVGAVDFEAGGVAVAVVPAAFECGEDLIVALVWAVVWAGFVGVPWSAAWLCVVACACSVCRNAPAALNARRPRDSRAERIFI